MSITINSNITTTQNYVTTALNTDVYQVQTGSTINFTNNYRIYGGGGFYGNGANALTIPSGATITTLFNTGVFNGGGGGGGGAFGRGGVFNVGGSGGVGGGGGGGGGNFITGDNGGSGDTGGTGGIGGFAGGGNGGVFGGGDGGDGGVNFEGGGGGGSGGGSGGSGGGGGYNGGNGGFGISNDGTITNLSNLQGLKTSTVSVGGDSVTTIPLYIRGNLPSNYKIIINDTDGRWGQLYGENVSGTMTFNIDSSSQVNFVGSTNQYTDVLNNNITPSIISGTQIINGGSKLVSWSLSSGTLTLNDLGSPCYNEGTTILSVIDGKEEYIPIENLRPGNLIKTYLYGLKPIDLIGKSMMLNDPSSDLKSMYIIKSFDEMTDDLLVTGGHYILVDKIPENITREFYKRKIMIDDKYILLTCDYEFSKKIEEKKIYTIYMLSLKGEQERYGIYVNGGLLSESTSKKNFEKHKNSFTLIE